LIARLDLPLGIGETEAFEDYIIHVHNPRFVKSSRRTTTRDLGKQFNERRDVLKNSILSAASIGGFGPRAARAAARGEAHEQWGIAL
jgi:sarcosine oxidase delta subunit